MTTKNNNNTLSIEYKSVKELIVYARNTRTHSDEQVTQLMGSIKEFGWTNPVLIDEEGVLIAGHGRLMAAERLALEEVPAITLTGLTEAQKQAYRIADNRLPLNAGWNEELLKIEINELIESGFDIDTLGFTQLEIDDLLDLKTDVDIGELSGGNKSGSLFEKFLFPPFTVLSARDGKWQERKKQWIALGIKSEEGRDESLTFNKSHQPPAVYDEKNRYEEKVGKKVSWDEFFEANPDVKLLPGTSIFDPVLCELAYRWFSPEGGLILDPFSGGSVRGVVAAKTKRNYIGCDLRAEQISANIQQWEDIKSSDDEYTPIWKCGDSTYIRKHTNNASADFIFSCPPYADLEVYSDNPDDLSTMDYPEFLKAYRQIIKECVSMLKEDRFACFVVGDVRDKKGIYRNFVSDTIQAFIDAGADYYNEAILATSVGGVAMTASRTFKASRKLSKTHQNILVFVKGDPKKATLACGDIEIEDIGSEVDEEVL